MHFKSTDELCRWVCWLSCKRCVPHNSETQWILLETGNGTIQKNAGFTKCLATNYADIARNSLRQEISTHWRIKKNLKGFFLIKNLNIDVLNKFN